jgi:hypothetical protein
MTVEFIPHTKRRRMTRARAARIFLARNGICFNCRRQIRGGEKWFIEHPQAIAQGGSDNDADLWPSHVKNCKAEKDAADAAAKAKRDRLVTASWEPEEGHRFNWGRRSLGRGNQQHTATTPPKKRVGYFED